MKISLKLSEEGIERAIQRIEEIRENLLQDTGEFVDILLTEGEAIANSSYDGMATAWGERDSEQDGIVTGHIGVSGNGKEDLAYIAEFGAGDTTTAVNFENAGNLPIGVYPGAYSELHAKQYVDQGWWQFGGASYRYVEPRMGLYNAKMMILSQGNDIARGVILHDQH